MVLFSIVLAGMIAVVSGCVSLQALVILRGLMGVGLGGAPVAFALFLELVPSTHRGVLMVTLQGFWTIGSMLEV